MRLPTHQIIASRYEDDYLWKTTMEKALWRARKKNVNGVRPRIAIEPVEDGGNMVGHRACFNADGIGYFFIGVPAGYVAQNLPLAWG